MSKWLLIPLIGPIRRILLENSGFRVTEDDEGKVFLMDELDNCYEVDMKLESLMKLMQKKAFIAKGRRKLKEEPTTLRIAQSD